MTAKIKLNAASGGGSISIQAPSSSSNNRVISLPDIADGTLVTSQSTLDATKLSGALPAISGANLTGITAGITKVDQWRINSNFNSQQEIISFNWERVDNSFAQIGTGMSYSSGIFSFPQTGIYLVEFHATMYLTNESARYMGIFLEFTEDNSNYTRRAEGFASVTNNSTSYQQAQVKYILDISDISNRKVRFGTDSEKSISFSGSTVENRTVATFIRLGDT